MLFPSAVIASVLHLVFTAPNSNGDSDVPPPNFNSLKPVLHLRYSDNSSVALPLESPFVDSSLPILSTSPSPFLKLGTKTRYHPLSQSISMPNESLAINFSKSSKTFTPDTFCEDCYETKQVQYVTRHGTRNPTSGMFLWIDFID
jgi:hypothetical protein